MIKMNFGMIKTRNVVQDKLVFFPIPGEERLGVKKITVQKSVDHEIWVGDKWVAIQDYQKNMTYYNRRWMKMRGTM